MKNIFIGCSASEKIPNKYFVDCKKYLDKLFIQDYNLVMGGYGKGLMEISYNSAKECGREIFLVCINEHKSKKNEIIVNSVSNRTSEIIALSDAFIILPGGIGTLNELFSLIEAKRSKEIDKPIIIYNSKGFYNKLLEFMNKIIKLKFISNKDFEKIHISNSIDDTLKYLNQYKK